MVIMNNSDKSQTIKTNRFQENLQNFSVGRDVITDQAIDLKNDITIENQSVLILELK
jgi:hypothetical protein